MLPLVAGESGSERGLGNYHWAEGLGWSVVNEAMEKKIETIMLFRYWNVEE